MKTKWILFPVLIIAAILPTLWLQQGCAGKYPPLAVMVVTPTPTLAPDVISNFNAGTTLVNPNLSNTNGHPGYFSTNTYGGSPPNKINNPFLFPNPGDGSNYAIRINTPLSGTGAYEADQLICTLTSGGSTPYYNASAFTGVQFSLYILPDDTNTQRVFQIGTDVTTPIGQPGGTCPSGCYNHYQATLPGPTGGWVTETFNWNQIVYPGYGTNNGPDVSTHLQKLLFLQWAFSANGAVGTTQTDFWVDNVKFLP